MKELVSDDINRLEIYPLCKIPNIRYYPVFEPNIFYSQLSLSNEIQCMNLYQTLYIKFKIPFLISIIYKMFNSLCTS